MCFHFKQTKTEGSFRLQKIGGTPITGVFNGFAFPKVSCVTADDPYNISNLNWGLIPQWSKTEDIKQYTLNARIETLDEKPSFKHAKRCVIFADGFFEWKWLDPKGRKKQKYLIEYPNSALFGFAGLYDQWVDKATGEIIKSCSLVTTAAEGIMKEVHNSKLRMPLTVNIDSLGAWLNNQTVADYSDFKAVPAD
jgi:putative SOS response-associated peptidase YedK